jgi:hypothetical protein
VIRTKTEECVREGVFNMSGRLIRRCDWRIWPEDQRREDQIGEAIWFDASGVEIVRRPLREQG